jgi:hypothetical protein
LRERSEIRSMMKSFATGISLSRYWDSRRAENPNPKSQNPNKIQNPNFKEEAPSKALEF